MQANDAVNQVSLGARLLETHHVSNGKRNPGGHGKKMGEQENNRAPNLYMVATRGQTQDWGKRHQSFI